MKHLRRSLGLTSLALALSLAACHHQQPEPQPPPPPPPAPVVVETVAAPPPPAQPTPTEEAHAELRANRIEINQMVEFRENSEALHERADRILGRVIEVLHAHPEIHHLRIEGHTDNLGAAEHNQHLSEQRAETVEHYLHAHGVTIQIDHAGFGATRPLCTEDTDPCRWRNRRVDFIVVDPAAH